MILGAGIAVLQKGLTLTQPKYEIHAQHRADVVDRRAGHDDRNGWSRSRNQRSRSTGITGHVAPEYPVRQVIDRGHSVIDVAKRLGIGDGLLYTWVKKFKAANEPVAIDDMKSMQAELNRLKAELRRTTEERDILKKAAAYFAKQSE